MNRLRHPARFAFWLTAGLLCTFPSPAPADPFLGQLRCVSIQASYLDVGEPFGLTIRDLAEALRAGLATHVPGLKIDAGCPDQISYKVYLQSFTVGTVGGFFGHVALQVTRKAIFRDTALLATTRAWDLESYLSGTRDKARSSVLDQLDGHLKQFAVDYRAANKASGE
jgi:hypothetical protein